MMKNFYNFAIEKYIILEFSCKNNSNTYTNCNATAGTQIADWSN